MFSSLQVSEASKVNLAVGYSAVRALRRIRSIQRRKHIHRRWGSSQTSNVNATCRAALTYKLPHRCIDSELHNVPSHASDTHTAFKFVSRWLRDQRGTIHSILSSIRSITVRSSSYLSLMLWLTRSPLCAASTLAHYQNLITCCHLNLFSYQSMPSSQHCQSAMSSHQSRRLPQHS
jgi:hypothetical protein